MSLNSQPFPATPQQKTGTRMQKGKDYLQFTGTKRKQNREVNSARANSTKIVLSPLDDKFTRKEK